MTKTRAIAEAADLCYMIPNGKGWMLISPYRHTKPHGPRAENTYGHYSLALEARTYSRTMVALSLLGKLSTGGPTDEEWRAIRATGSVRERVNHALGGEK